MTAPQAIKPHGLSREEWVRRFKAALVTQACLDGMSGVDELLAAELTSWPEVDDLPVEGFDPEWMTEEPESAAAENLSAWGD